MNYHEFNRYFKEQNPGWEKVSKTTLRTMWNDALHFMHRDGRLPDRCLNWSHPKFLKA